MKLFIPPAFVCAALLTGVICSAYSAGGQSVAENEASRFSQMYFAPMDGANFYRLYAPGTGMVEFRRNWSTGGLDGAGGWTASLSGADATVREPGSGAVYSFRNGRPNSMVSSDGRNVRMDFDDEPVIQGRVPPMWEGAREEALETAYGKWLNSGRFSLFFVNPNHTAMLLAEIALLGLFVFLYIRRWWLFIPGAALFASAAYYLMKTDGRGGFLALAAGSFILLVLKFFRRGGRWKAVLVALLAAAAVGAFFYGSGLGGRFSTTSLNDNSSQVRFEKWRCVPRMMFESPHGWETSAGRAYSDWYQPLGSNSVTPTLDSDHLTYMTGFGWFGRFLWAFAWLFALFALFRFYTCGGSPLALAEMSAMGLAAMFNPLLHVWALWIVPAASLLEVAASRPWRKWRTYLLPLGMAAFIAFVICDVFYFSGRKPSRSAVLSVSTDGRRVYVGSRNPDIWIADDRYTVGWLFAPKEIRHFYYAHPGARPLGYVQDLTAVPPHVRRLAVAGGLCREYLRLWEAGAAPVADELIFLSPNMPLDAIPTGLRAKCRFAMVVGEFAARYEGAYGHLKGRDGVVVIEGAEDYLPGWVGLILSL